MGGKNEDLMEGKVEGRREGQRFNFIKRDLKD